MSYQQQGNQNYQYGNYQPVMTSNYTHQEQQQPLLYNARQQQQQSTTPNTLKSSILWALKAVSFLMAFDLMVVFLTVRDYWVEEGGSYGVYGLVFSSYSIAQFVFIPVVSWWLDKYSLKHILVITVALNVIGNVLYGFGGSAPSGLNRALIVIGRIIAGAGAGNIVTGPYYIVKNTPDVTTRSLNINNFNLAGFLGRVAGPLVAFAIFEIPEKTIAGIELNHNTWPPLLTAVLGLVVLAFVMISTDKEDARPAPQPVDAVSAPLSRVIFPDLIVFLVVTGISFFIFWGWYVNVITLGGIQYGYAQKYGDSVYLEAYLPALVGSLVANYGYKILTRRGVEPMGTLLLGPVLMAAGLIVQMDYGTQDSWRFWLGSILVISGSNFGGVSSTPLYSHIVESTGHTQLLARLLGLLTLAQAVGRGIGPIWTPVLLYVTGDAGCCTFSSGRINDCSCCDIHGVNTVFGILLAASLILAGGIYMFARPVMKKYPKQQELTSVQ